MKRLLAGLGATAAVLALALTYDVLSARAPVSRLLVPDFDAAQLRSLTWIEGERVGLVRDGAAWRWEQDGARGAADPATVGAVLAALRGAAWQRTGPVPPTHGTLQLDLGHGAGPKIGFGPPLAGTAQTWLAIDGRGVLVEDWVVRALDPGAAALRERLPFAHAAAAEHLSYCHADVHGHPRRDGANVLVDAARAARFEAAIAAIELVRSGGGPMQQHGGTDTLIIDGLAAEVGNACPGDRELDVIALPSGTGCVPHRLVQELSDAADALHPQEPDRIERRLVPLPPKTITFADGATLDLVHRGGEDPARIAALLDALATPTELGPARTDCKLLLTADGPAGAIQLSVCGDHTLARDAEPASYRPSPAAFAALVRPAADYRDRTLWLEDPSTIAAFSVDAATYTRGESLGQWSGGDDPEKIEAAAAALAHVYPIDRTDPAFSPRRRITVTVHPPVGAPRTHALLLDDEHCTTATEQLPASLCAALRAL